MLIAGLSAQASTPPEVNEKVLKAFRETFTNAEEVKWQEYDTHYLANFWQKEINIRVKYDHEGNVLSTIRYYFEKDLPPHILGKLKKKFAGKTVYGVTELATDTEIIYSIKLHDDDTWYTVQSDAVGRFELKEKFKKA